MTITTDTIIVAADGGGTGCRACAGTLRDGMLAHASGGPGNVHSDFAGAIANLTGAVSEALTQAGLGHAKLDEITAHFGVAGAHSQIEKNAVCAALPYGASTVTGDRDTSVRGALGEADGYVVALGTGTIIARQSALNIQTVGGWGFDLSDQASGAWLGRRLLEEIVLCEDGLRAHTDLSREILASKGGLMGLIQFSADATPGSYAQMARNIVGAASEGDTLALELLGQGARYVEGGLRSLGFVKGNLLSLGGGLGPHYAPHLSEDLTGNLIPPKGTALEGAFAMAAQAAKAAR